MNGIFFVIAGRNDTQVLVDKIPWETEKALITS